LARWWRETGDGVEVFIRLTPKSSRDAIEGIETAADGIQHLKARVRAVPEDGKANIALIMLVSKVSGWPKSAISIRGGAASRLKKLAIECEAGQRGQIVARLGGS
jgi:uncharacterized protein YggU (UPF0235/DUF167 family)